MMVSDKMFWKDVCEALHRSMDVFYKYLEEKKGYDARLAIRISVYEISSDYKNVLDELHYTNLGTYLDSYSLKFQKKDDGDG